MQLFTPIQYLMIDIASNYGLDKEEWSTRLQWFEDHKNCLHEMLATAETPALYFAGVSAYEKALKQEPSGYPISLDATSSGLQLLAVLTGDRSAAELCNVINNKKKKRNDAYTKIYQAMLELMGGTSKIKRADVKDAIMTSLYGSTAVPKQVFGDGPLLDLFHHVIERSAPAAWELNQAFLMMWDSTVTSHDWVMPDNFHVHIKVMDNVKDKVVFLDKPYEVYHKENRPKEQGRSLGANTIHSLDGMIVRELTRRCSYNPKQVEQVLYDVMMHGRDEAAEWLGIDMSNDVKMLLKLWDNFEETGYLSARILDYISSTTARYVDRQKILELIESLPKKPFNLLSIHDCFRCLPAYGNDLRKQYNLQLALIAESNILSSIISQIMGKHVPIYKHRLIRREEILDAEYALS